MTPKSKLLTVIIWTALLYGLLVACKDKKTLPESPSVITGREGDTCRLTRVSLTNFALLTYEYTGTRPRKVTIQGQNGIYPCEFVYDSQGRLLKATGTFFDTSYEYDSKGRVTKENRNLFNPGVENALPHYSARIFEYNELDQVAKCSYVEGKGTDYNSFYVKKGDVYRYENYAYDVDGDMFSMIAFERGAKDIEFKMVSDRTYFYDKQINPFYGPPGLFDVVLHLGFDVANAPAVFSKHNIVRVVEKGVSRSTSYTYSNTKYPLTATKVPLTNGNFLDGIEFEYVNCK